MAIALAVSLDAIASPVTGTSVAVTGWHTPEAVDSHELKLIDDTATTEDTAAGITYTSSPPKRLFSHTFTGLVAGHSYRATTAVTKGKEQKSDETAFTT